MKQKLLVLVVSSFILTSCTNTNPNNYKLEDTWGANGDWGGKKSTQTAQKQVKSTPAVKVNNTQKPVVNNVANKVTTSKPVSKTVKVNLPYDLKMPSGWSLKGNNYIKNIDGQELIVSVGTLKNLGESDLDSRFKDGYANKISEKMPDAEVLSKQDVKVKGKDGWSISYSFEKDGNKIIQTQIFIPHKNNIYLLNMASTAEGFVKGKSDFKSITKNISFK